VGVGLGEDELLDRVGIEVEVDAGAGTDLDTLPRADASSSSRIVPRPPSSLPFRARS